ncbi:MAG TPA: serpin family protein, partial [Mucilaginibacter sp.]|nr:serpin family protein [Mucilaginibacter sp.]
MKNTCLLFTFLFLVIAFSSCKKDKNTPLPVDKGIELSLSSDELQQASADNTFTFSLFKEVAGENTNGANLLVSPLSVSMALGMTSNGANGETLKAIDSTLNFTGFSQDAINSYYNKLVTELPKLDPNTTLKISNSIWYDQKFSVLPQFIQTDSSYFHAAVQPLDFTSKSAVTTINNWVSDQTNGKIKQLLNSIQPSEVMYL